MRWWADRSARRWAAAALLACACARAPAALPPPPPLPSPPILPTRCERIVAIEVHKSERRLIAHCEGGDVVQLPVAVGRANVGPKRDAGDSRTPEGHYRVSGPAHESRFHRFVPIDYPSLADAEVGLADGRLSEADYRRIADAHARGETPPPDTALGGALGFHGEGARWAGDSQFFDWTYGCIALADRDVDFIAARVEVGTPVVIEP
ncbi:MAG TPA: L,D-transpeptidase [Myxococcota bacterium]|nr:L,D-transpeptidase [Myxococcota bacterium]